MRPLHLGLSRQLDGSHAEPLLLPPSHLVTHGVVVGMTGTGKTGLLMVLAEEALLSGVPTIIVDVKGDLPNLLLTFPDFEPKTLLPWLEDKDGPMSVPLDKKASSVAEERKKVLSAWSIAEPELRQFCSTSSVRVLTPGASSGEPLHMISTLERRSSRWDTDKETARDALSASVSLVLRLLGRDPDPAKSKEHVLLSVLAERRFSLGDNAELASLMEDLLTPPIERIGALPLDSFLKKTERRNLAAALNTLLASPTFASWREGATLDVGAWVKRDETRTPCVIVSVAHLDDEDRALVLGVLLEEILCWVRTLSGSNKLKALVIFDEVYGFLPPYPANPPTKRPMVALMKQARAFGVGIIVATQNPMDLDYRALSNAGLWCLGRLQTDADRERVIDGLAAAESAEEEPKVDLDTTLQRLAPRWFVVRDIHTPTGPVLLQPRHTMSFMVGPMTRNQLREARGWRAVKEGER